MNIAQTIRDLIPVSNENRNRSKLKAINSHNSIPVSIDSDHLTNWVQRVGKRKNYEDNDIYLDSVLYQLYPGTDVPLARGDLTTYLEAYQKMLWVFLGVNTIATNGARVPGRVYEKKDNKLNEAHDHPVLELLETPNAIDTEYEAKVKTLAYVELSGRCFWFLHKNAIPTPFNGQIYSKYVIPRPDRIEAKLISDDEIQYYDRQNNLNIFPAETVVHFTNFNPLLTHDGYPTIAPGGNNLLLDWYLELYGNKFFKVGIQPTMAFKVPGRMSAESEDRFRADLRRLHEGVDNMFRTLVLQNGMEVEDMNMRTPVDTQYVETKKSTRDNILMNLGCYHLVALLQERSGESIKVANNMFWEETMLPRLENNEQTITKFLVRKYPNSRKLYYKYDTRQVSGLRDDLLDESLAYFRLVQSKIMGHKEAREKMGLPREMETDDTTGIGYEPALSRTVSNPERSTIEDETNQLSDAEANKLRDKKEQLKKSLWQEIKQTRK